MATTTTTTATTTTTRVQVGLIQNRLRAKNFKRRQQHTSSSHNDKSESFYIK
jgi:hypothetical protein